MVEEKLEKEAKQSYLDNTDRMQWDAEGEFDYTRGYINAAEPREKQIEELEKNLKLWTDTKDARETIFFQQKQKIAELEQELEQAKKVQVVEHFEAYGQCRDSRRIAVLENENKKLKELLKKIYNFEYGVESDFPKFDLVKWSIETRDFLKECE